MLRFLLIIRLTPNFFGIPMHPHPIALAISSFPSEDLETSADAPGCDASASCSRPVTYNVHPTFTTPWARITACALQRLATPDTSPCVV